MQDPVEAEAEAYLVATWLWLQGLGLARGGEGVRQQTRQQLHSLAQAHLCRHQLVSRSNSTTCPSLSLQLLAAAMNMLSTTDMGVLSDL